MKKIVLMLSALALVLMAVTGCKEKGLQNIRGEVKHVEIHQDTLISMTVSVTEQGDTMLFDLGDARFQNGIMMPRDSVIVDYIEGRGDTLRALVVTVLPKIKPFAEPLTTDTLITAPVEEKK